MERACAWAERSSAMAPAHAPDTAAAWARRHCMGRPHPRGTFAQNFAMSVAQDCRSLRRAASTAAFGGVFRAEGCGQFIGVGVCASAGPLATRSKARPASRVRMRTPIISTCPDYLSPSGRCEAVASCLGGSIDARRRISAWSSFAVSRQHTAQWRQVVTQSSIWPSLSQSAAHTSQTSAQRAQTRL